MTLDTIAISHRKESRAPCYVELDLLPGGLIAKVPGGNNEPPSKKRGNIQGFSLKSRARLRRILMGIDFDHLAGSGKRAKTSAGFLVTLTYPRDWPGDWQQWKTHLDRFSKRIHRLPGFKFAVWRLERQRRGAPHYHIIVAFDDPKETTQLKGWVLSSWHESIGTDDPYHANIGADTRALYCDNSGKLLRYLLKYLAKADNGALWSAGRMWGVWGEIPDGLVVRYLFTKRKEWVEFVRRIRRWGKRSRYLRKRTQARGFAIMGCGASITRLFDGLDVQILYVKKGDVYAM